MAANEANAGVQVMKRYQLFKVENSEEKIIKKSQGAEKVIEDSISQESAKIVKYYRVPRIICDE